MAAQDAFAVSGEISVVGFAIQRALQIVDPIIDAILSWKVFKDREVTPADLKRTAMALLAVGAGFYVAYMLDLHLLRDLGVSCSSSADLVVSAFVMSAGAEGANSVIKLLESVKTQRKSAAEAVALSIPVAAFQVKPGDKGLLIAAVANADDDNAIWAAVEPALIVDAASGAFTAPTTEGTYHAVAWAKVDRTKTGTVTITVKA